MEVSQFLNQDSISLGGYVYYRYRSLDSTSMTSEWSEGNFILPNLQTVNNNDGTATLILGSDVLDIQWVQIN